MMRDFSENDCDKGSRGTLSSHGISFRKLPLNRIRKDRNFYMFLQNTENWHFHWLPIRESRWLLPHFDHRRAIGFFAFRIGNRNSTQGYSFLNRNSMFCIENPSWWDPLPDCSNTIADQAHCLNCLQNYPSHKRLQQRYFSTFSGPKVFRALVLEFSLQAVDQAFHFFVGMFGCNQRFSEPVGARRS